jgi:drug/metabolite transporter (DMT)-like permease
VAVVVCLSLLAACCYAVAMVLEQHSARGLGEEASLQPSLLPRLLVRPLWGIGVLANVAGYSLRFLALGHGSLLVVQPLMGSSLLMALPASAHLQGQRLRRAEWWAAGAIVVGLALLLGPSGDEKGATSAPAGRWVVAVVAVTVVAAGLVAAARRPDMRYRAPLLAAAGGLLLGLTAALTKAMAAAASHDLAHLPFTWSPYAVAAVGALGVFVVQSAFATAPLSASLPTLMVVESLASVALGWTVFGERLAGGPLGHTVEAVGLVVAVAGVAVASASPRLDAPHPAAA